MPQRLSETNPDIWEEAIRYPAGIRFFHVPGQLQPELLVKLPAMFLLAARVNGGLRLHVLPIQYDGESTLGLMTVFTDDDDNPLTVWSPLFLEPESLLTIRTLLSAKTMTVRLVDEHDRELLAYESTIEVPLEARVRLEHVKLLPISHQRAHALSEAAQIRFNARDDDDENRAIKVQFKLPLYPERRVYRDERPDLFNFHGSKGFAEVALERLEPGQFQELDILLMLQRVFRPEQIFHAPKRVYDKEEICDVLVITDSLCLVIQAKDSPNTEKTLGLTLDRKMRKALSQLKEGCAQVRGAIGYLKRIKPLKFFIDEQQTTIDLGHRNVLSIVITRELFLTCYDEYSATLLSLHDDIGLPCIGLDYQEFIQYCTFCPSEPEFVNAYLQVFDFGIEHGEFPRLRFGVNDLMDEDGNFRFR